MYWTIRTSLPKHKYSPEYILYWKLKRIYVPPVNTQTEAYRNASAEEAEHVHEAKALKPKDCILLIWKQL